MVRRILVVLTALVLMGGPVWAQSLSEGQIAVIDPKPVLVQQRLELAPRFGLSFNDSLLTQFLVGGSLYYHINEDYYVGATFEWFDFEEIGGTTDTFEEVIRYTSAIPEVAPMKWDVTADFGWVPIHGKFSLFDAAIVYYDFYLLGGLGVVTTIGDPLFAGVIGVGQHTYIGRWLALTIELRDRMYVQPLESGNSFTNVLTATLGVSFFFPAQTDMVEERILDWE